MADKWPEAFTNGEQTPLSNGGSYRALTASPSPSPSPQSSPLKGEEVGDGHRRARLPGLGWSAFSIAALLGLLAACASEGDVPALEQRAQALNQTIMCPVCPGESIDQSQHTLAGQMRAIVDEKLAAGWSEESIQEFFAERYGPSVLLEPSTRGFTALVWIIPPLGAIAAAAGLFFVLKTMRRSSPTGFGAATADLLSDAERDRYFSRIEAAVDESRPEEGATSEGAG